MSRHADMGSKRSGLQNQRLSNAFLASVGVAESYRRWQRHHRDEEGKEGGTSDRRVPHAVRGRGGSGGARVLGAGRPSWATVVATGTCAYALERATCRPCGQVASTKEREGAGLGR